MLGIEDYGSDNDSDNETPKSASSLLSPSEKALPLTSSLSLPAPKSSKRGPKKITIGLPTFTADGSKDDEPPPKKQRLESGAGASSLLSMLPAPKQKNPVLPTPERVLGGGNGPGLIFNVSRSSMPKTTSDETNEPPHVTELGLQVPVVENADALKVSSFSFLPPSLVKGRSNVSLEDEGKKHVKPTAKVTSAPAVDFFSLGAVSSSSSQPPNSVVASTPTTSSLPSLTSAPPVPTFSIPEPTPTDPYPGYYQLPTGTWVAHDPTYYSSFMKKWESEYNAHVRALEKGMVKGFEDMDKATVQEVDAMRVMEKAKIEIQAREEKKAITKGADGGPVAPKMNINASKMSGIARSRHQLSTLLREAYENREALEERIAEGRRNRKEAGNKYGF